MAVERQLPGGPFVNETGAAQRQTPGSSFINETAGGGPQADSVAYAAGAGDQFAAQLKLAGTFTSDAGAGDAVSASGKASVTYDDVAVATDALTSTQAFAASISEQAAALFDNSAAGIFVDSITASAIAAFVVDGSLALEPRYGRPVSTDTQGAWLSSGAPTLHEAVDEESASDTDYIYTTGASTCKLKLTSLADPGTSNNHRVSLRIPSGFSPNGSLTVALYQGASTEIASWTEAAPAADTQYDYDLTGTEIDSITDYTDLYLWITAAA